MAKRMIAHIIAATLVIYLPAVSLSQQDKLSAALATILQDREAIHVGDTQAQLEKLFDPDGGLSSYTERTYVSRRCAYVKVDVRFREAKPVRGKPETFIVTAVSRLYVDYPKVD